MGKIPCKYLFICLTFFYLRQQWYIIINESNLPPIEVGYSAPDFEAQTLDSTQFKLSTLRGKYVLLNFWSIGCGPCRKKIPELIELYKYYPRNELEIIGVAD